MVAKTYRRSFVLTRNSSTHFFSILLNDKLTPTGERKPFPASQHVELKGRQFDDVFTSLDPNSDFVLEGGGKKIAVRFGEKWRVAVVYAPPGRDFVCFEPMSALTNAFNLAHAGKYDGLQMIAPGGQWRESFWVKPSY
jgi:aldose 1-epimerase